MAVPTIITAMSVLGIEMPQECPACNELNCFMKTQYDEYMCHTCGTVLDANKEIIGNIFHEDYIAATERHRTKRP